MAALSVQSVVDAGTKPTFSAATTSDTAPIGNGKNTFVVYKNGDTGSHTLTIAVLGNEAYGTAKPQKTVTVAASGEVWVPLRKDYDDTTGHAALALDAATGMTVAVVQVS